jgi:hypothetical protein
MRCGLRKVSVGGHRIVEIEIKIKIIAFDGVVIPRRIQTPGTEG